MPGAMDSGTLFGIAVGIGCGICVGFILRGRVKGSPVKGLAENGSLASGCVGESGENKLVLVVRTDLKMGKGKAAAQCSHAAVMSYKSCARINPALLKNWEYSGQPKVVVKTDSEDDLLQLANHARSLGLIVSLVQDAGRTQIAPHSKTVIGVGPDGKGPAQLIADHDPELTGHIEELDKMCRICGKEAKLSSKYQFKEELTEYFNINIETGNVSIHPVKICNSHRSLMYRIKNAKLSGRRLEALNSTLGVIHDFQPHSSECQICSISKPTYQTIEHSYAGEKRSMPIDNTSTLSIPKVIKLVEANKKDTNIDENMVDPRGANFICELEKCDVGSRYKCLKYIARHLNNQDKINLVQLLVDSEKESIKRDISQLEDSYKSPSNLKCTKLEGYISQRNTVLSTFVMAVGSHTECTCSDSETCI